LKYKYNLPNDGEKKICGRCYNQLQTQAKQFSLVEDHPTSDELNKPFTPIDITRKYINVLFDYTYIYI
jgi:hypothetical protein